MNPVNHIQVTSQRTAYAWIISLVLLGGLFSACQPQTGSLAMVLPDEQTEVDSEESLPVASEVTPLPTRPPYSPGELVDYTVQSGDNMPALASRFNTSID